MIGIISSGPGSRMKQLLLIIQNVYLKLEKNLC